MDSDKAGATKAPSKPARRDEKKKEREVAVGGGGYGADFPSFPSAPSDTAGFGADFGAFGTADVDPANFGGAEGFGNFDDKGETTTAAPTPTRTTTTSTSDDNAGFGTGFGATDAFGTFETEGSGFTGDSNAFFSEPAPSFDTPQLTKWDKSPLTDIPQRPQSPLTLYTQPTLAAAFLGKPTTNPANGNIIYCAKGRDGVVYMREVDPYRDNLQVASTPVLSADLQRKLATKYSVSACSLESVITLTGGLHHAHGQARLRVAAILDLRVVESHQVMRVVAVWQWGYAAPYSIALQYALTPPSGGDFTYDSFSLQVADGLFFIAGSSPKGPCIFMCKPAVRETWSANFLPGVARITCMAVTPSVTREHPYLAVAFNDGTVSVWTYKTALSGAAVKGNEPSKRWLFPLCRLEGHGLLAEMETTSLREEGYEKGKRTRKCANLFLICF